MFLLTQPLIVAAAVLQVSFAHAPFDIDDDESISLLQAQAKRVSAAAAAEARASEADGSGEQKQHDLHGVHCELPSQSGTIWTGDGERLVVDVGPSAAELVHEGGEHGEVGEVFEEVEVGSDEEALDGTETDHATWFFIEAGMVLGMMSCVKLWTHMKPKAEGAGSNAAAYDPAQRKEVWTKFMRAALAGDTTKGLSLLQTNQLPLGESDIWGSTALHAAAKGGSLSLVQSLLERGMGLHAMDAWDETPLHLAARSGHRDICEELILHGSLVDAMNAEDATPLLVAGGAEQEAVCKLLLARGAAAPEVTEALPPTLRQLLAPDEVSADTSVFEWDYWVKEQPSA